MFSHVFFLEYNGASAYKKIDTATEKWTRGMKISDLKELIEESTGYLVEDQRLFYAGIHLSDSLQMDPEWVGCNLCFGFI